MTVSNPLRVVTAIGNGVTTTWPFNFVIPAGMAEVTLTNIATATEGPPINPSAYTIIGEDALLGGTVEYPITDNPILNPVVPLSSDYKINIKRVVPIRQNLALNEQSAYFPTVLERQLDLIVMMIAQLDEAIGRAVLVDTGSGIAPNNLLALAQTAAAAAYLSEVAAAASASAALASEAGVIGEADLASKWATEEEDVEVAPGLFSAYHWARKAVAIVGGDAYLLLAENLNDLPNKSAARTNLGIGSVNNTSDAAKPVSTAQQTALNLKAPLASPALTGTPTAPTPAAGTNTTQLATTAFVLGEVAGGASFVVNAIGSYMLGVEPGALNLFGFSYAGSTLTPAGLNNSSLYYGGGVRSGTWRCMGHKNSGVAAITLYARVA